MDIEAEGRTFPVCVGKGQAFDKWVEKPVLFSEKETKESED